MTSHAVLSLYRQFLRHAARITNYNFKAHAKRRIAFEFRSNTHLAEQDMQSHMVYAKEQLALLKRQSVLSTLYPEGESIMQQTH